MGEYYFFFFYYKLFCCCCLFFLTNAARSGRIRRNFDSNLRLLRPQLFSFSCCFCLTNPKRYGIIELEPENKIPSAALKKGRTYLVLSQSNFMSAKACFSICLTRSLVIPTIAPISSSVCSCVYSSPSVSSAMP